MKTYPPGHFTALLRKHDWPPGIVERLDAFKPPRKQFILKMMPFGFSKRARQIDLVNAPSEIGAGA